MKLREENSKLREKLFTTSTDLIKQTSIAIDGENVIKNLTKQMQNLDNSLRVAFTDIKQLHITLHSAKKLEKSFEAYVPKQDDEIDQVMSNFCNRVQLPVSFKRLSEGTYLFGTQTLQVNLLNGKLNVQVESDSLPIEEFIQLNAQKKLAKMKQEELVNNVSFTQPRQESIQNIPERVSPNAQEEKIVVRDVNQPRLIQLQKITTEEVGTHFEKENMNEASPHSSSFSPAKSRSNKRAKPGQDGNQSQEFSFSPNKSQRSYRESPNKEEFITDNDLSPINNLESAN